METYSDYQDTGIAWMPQIPHHWKYLQFRGLFTITKKIAGRKGLDVLAVTQRGIKVKDVESNEGQIAADYSNYQIVEPGDFAMNHMDLITGFVGISSQYGVTSPDYRVFKNTNPLANSRYYLYIFELCYKQRIFYGLGHGVSNKGRWRLPAPIQNRFNIPLPPLAEQERIVSYLDNKTSKIDAYVADKEKEIELFQELKQKTIAEAVTKGLNSDVKMKDYSSLISLSCPEHWDIIRNKFFLSLTGEKVGSKAKEYTLLSLTTKGIIIRDVESGKGKFPKDFDTYQYVKKDELVFCLFDIDETPRTVGIVETEGMLTGAYTALKVNSDLALAEYIYNYYLCVDNIKALRPYYSGLRKTIRADKFLQIYMPLPPLDEQRAIVTYIDEKCQKIDTLITELQAEIDHLKEYKQRLIADVVTGQVNVQNL